MLLGCEEAIFDSQVLNLEVGVLHRPFDEFCKNIKFYLVHFRGFQTQFILLNMAENRDRFSLLGVELVQDLEHPALVLVFEILIVILLTKLPELLFHILRVEKLVFLLLILIQIDLGLIKDFPEFALSQSNGFSHND